MIHKSVERFHLQDDSGFLEQRRAAFEHLRHCGSLILASHALKRVARLRDDGGDVQNLTGFNRIMYPGDI